MKKLCIFVLLICWSVRIFAQAIKIYQPNGSTTNFGKVAVDSLNYYVLNYPALTLMKIDGSNLATPITTLTADPFQTMIWNRGKGIYPVANGSAFKLFDGTNAIDLSGGELPMAGYTADKVIQADYFHRGAFTYFRTQNKIYKTDFTSAASIQTLAVCQNTSFVGGIYEMQHTPNAIIYWEVGTSTVAPNQLKRIDLITGLITKIDSSSVGAYDYGCVYNNAYYYCTPFGPASQGNSKVCMVSDNGTKTVLFTETATNKNLLRIIGVSANGVIAIMSTTGSGMEYVSIAGGVATSLNFNTVANARPCGNVGVGGSRTTSSLVYFVTLDTLYTVNSNNKALWVTDGTLAGTKKVVGGTPSTFAAEGLSPQFPGSAEHCGNDLFFSGKLGANADRLVQVNGSNYAVSVININAGATTQPSFRKTAAGIYFIALPLPTSSAEKAVYKVDCLTATGIVANTNSNLLFEVAPNPSQGVIQIKLPETGKAYTATLFNLLGEALFMQDLTETTTLLNLQVSSGLYSLVLEYDGQRASKKIVVE